MDAPRRLDLALDAVLVRFVVKQPRPHVDAYFDVEARLATSPRLRKVTFDDESLVGSEDCRDGAGLAGADAVDDGDLVSTHDPSV